jgi:hypothetical protein
MEFSMSVAEKLVVKIFTEQGGQFGVLTQMPKQAINDEVNGKGVFEDPYWIMLIGLDQDGNKVDFRCRREDVNCYMIMPFKNASVPMIQPAAPSLVLQ